MSGTIDVSNLNPGSAGGPYPNHQELIKQRVRIHHEILFDSARSWANCTMKRNIHWVGSMGLEDTPTVFRSLAEHLGERAKRYPDGETGELDSLTHAA
ncbi:MAG: hypothetical protein ETSY2_43635 [Candidatus Entotheonella gemina]|uniref:Uncharacterized protein n=1 Tax=Candidatus Entotheonella gemina TaxID=1429439 RepID=W4LIY2_9BACT|nr:MAG: hypothetical protein ETSY2_43635 [Candidatus Entotheonella gemina]